MQLSYSQLVLLGLAAPSLAAPMQGNGTHPEKLKAIKDVYQLSWRAYYKHAFPHDTLAPLNNTWIDDRNRWGVSAVDSLSSSLIVGDEESVNQILEFIPTIDFTTTAEPGDISVFETNIRYLGGLLSAYDLMSLDKYRSLVKDKSLIEDTLKQAKSLADSIKFAFDTPSGIPDPIIRLNPEPARNGSTENNIAECGTLVLEWTRLSDLTGDPEYAELAQKAQSYLLKPEPSSGEPFPGLVGTHVSIEDGTFTNGFGGWGGYTDSFYEYLIKMYLYDPEEFEFYKERWVAAADSSMKHLASSPTTNEDLLFLADHEDTNIVPRSSHLGSFAGGNFILAGILLDEDKYVDFGVKLTDSYYETYNTPTGIGPEAFRWVAAEHPIDDEFNTEPEGDDADFYEETGFWATSPTYILRPETIESLYHAFRVTGDTKYQDMAWEAFENIIEHTRAGSAYSSIKDVTTVDSGFLNKMESFWLTETLQYLWLMFEDQSLEIHIDTGKWVYGTEAQPFKVREQK